MRGSGRSSHDALLASHDHLRKDTLADAEKAHAKHLRGVAASIGYTDDEVGPSIDAYCARLYVDVREEPTSIEVLNSIAEWIRIRCDRRLDAIMPDVMDSLLKMRANGLQGVPVRFDGKGPLPFGGPSWDPCLMRFVLCGEWAPTDDDVFTLIGHKNDGTKETIVRYTGADLVRLDALVRSLDERAKNLIFPPMSTASNVETTARSISWWLASSSTDPDDVKRIFILRRHNKLKFTERMSKALDVMVEVAELVCAADSSEAAVRFMTLWPSGNFARLEVGHRLASMFCFNTVVDRVDAPIRAPWDAWSLVVPNGLLGELARVWVVGIEPVVFLDRLGRHHPIGPVQEGMVRSLVASSAIALSDPDEFRKEKRHSPTARSKGRKTGAPDLSQATFLLSAPIEVDFRENVAAALDDERLGRKHASPKVQFIVRGHYKMQTHGEGSQLRKRIWVRPYWKGPEEGKVLLRSYKIGDPEPGTES